jgi:predicted MFS family arabinose efflux permease
VSAVESNFVDPLRRRTAWRVTAFLGAAAALNYGDRAAISSVFPLLRGDLGLSDASLGLVGAVFLWSYALCSPIAGVLADRVSRSQLIAWSIVLWSLVTGLTGMANGLATLVILRVALGVAESLFLPSAIALLGDHHGTATRAKAMSVLSIGLSVGMIAGGASVGYIAQHHGWRPGFWILGLLGVGLAAANRRFLTDGPANVRPSTAAKPSMLISLRYLMRVPTYHLLLLKTMLAGVGIWIFLNWMPMYYHETFGMGLGAAGFAGAFMLSVSAMLGAAGGGWLSDRLAVRDPRHRLLLLSLSYFAATPFLLVFLMRPSFTVISAALIVFSLLRGLGQSNENPCLCEVVPPQFRSTAVGFMNCFATAAGGAGVLLAGVLKEDFGLSTVFAGVSLAILVAGLALLAGYFWYMRRDIERAQDYARSAGEEILL